MVTACAIELAKLLTVISNCEVAVTIMLSRVQLIAPKGTITLSVALPEALGDKAIDEGDTTGDQLELSLVVSS
ncbi:hypothetical protein ES703_19617 [subsurface metagenome]